jgi:hypothetical protein
MTGIFDLSRIQNFEIVTNSLKCLIEISRLNYEHMDEYFNQIFNMAERMLS